VISATEIDLSVVSLRALDRDGDGTIVAEEMTKAPRGDAPPAAEPPAPAAGGGAVELPDSDGDGKITVNDMSPNLKPRFPDFDTNGDGELDSAEQKALAEQMKAHKQSKGKKGAAQSGAQGGEGDTAKTKGAGKAAKGAKGQAGGKGAKGAKKKPGGV